MLTWLIVIASSLHLSLYGFLPSFGYRFVGDGVLLVVLLIALSRGLLRSLKRHGHALPYGVAIAYLFYVLVLILYTFFLWQAEFTLMIRWARRWLIFGCYLLLLFSRVHTVLNGRVLRAALVFGALISAGVILLEKYFNIDLPGARIMLQYQGGLLVEKTFAPTNFLIVVGFLILLFEYLMQRRALVHFIMLSVMSVGFFSTINFRSWWIAAVISAIIASTAGSKHVTTLRRGLVYVVVVMLLFTSLSELQNLGRKRIEWLLSAFNDLTEVSGTWEYRYQNDIAKVVVLWDSGTLLYKLLGVGFVPQGSSAEMELGFSSETNDVGVVEILLTGGLSALVVLLMVFFTGISRICSLLRRAPDSPYVKASLATWLMAGLLMFTSNLLLWDFGFVPLILLGLLANAQVWRVDKRLKER